MRFYDFKTIAEHCDCRDIARDWYGCKINGTGRCAALWRGGDDPENVSIDREKFFDHVTKQGGGPIQLAAFKFGGDIQQAQQAIGDALGLTPTMETGRQPQECRYEELLRAGYKEVARYDYRDASGTLVHFVVRLQHPDKPGKEFCQGVPTPDGGVKWGLHGVTTVLYRLDVALESSWVAVVEGEKSADRMNSIGIPAVSACGGAKKWHDGLSNALAGKDIAIFPDNDEPGREHALVVAASLHGKARTIKIVQPAACLPKKAGIDDWLDAEGGHSADDVLALIVAAPEWHPAAALLHADTTGSGPTPAMLAEAKAANAIPFRNYIPVEKESEKRGRKTKETVKEPRTHRAMIEDLNRRFLGFPRKVGNILLFDHDRDSGKIIELDYAVDLKAWIGRRSKHNPEFARGDNLVSETEFYKSVQVEARSYESISEVPDWPRREEVYYAHETLPPASRDHHYLNSFVDMFLPATPYDRCLIKAFICCPLWYIPGIARPTWIIDSRDGQGSGKTNLVELVSELYGTPPITVCRTDLERDMKEVRKRCVSRAGRNARIFLVDNVVGNFKSPELSALISYKHISGMAPYGHGEESRQNNLVFCITSNSASIDTDIGDRSLFIYVRKPTSHQRKGWKETIQQYIKKHRLNIVADMVSMLSSHIPFGVPLRTRFSEYEEAVLQPCCGDPETFSDVLEYVISARADANVDEDHARSIIDTFTFNIERAGFAKDAPVFLHTCVVNSWGGTALAETRDKNSRDFPIQIVRNLAKMGMIPQIDPAMKKWPTSSKTKRYSGVAWNFTEATEHAQVITLDAEKNVKVVTLDRSEP